MGRLDTILRNLRRRDNIRDFVDDLIDTECWPYPRGKSLPIALAAFDEPVGFREGAMEELTSLYLINVERYFPNISISDSDPVKEQTSELVDVLIELSPEDGPGAYTVTYEPADKKVRSAAETINLKDVATLRSAFMHRFEWVCNKIESVNRERFEAWRSFDEFDGYEEPECLAGTENEAPPSEEEDHSAFHPDSDSDRPVSEEMSLHKLF